MQFPQCLHNEYLGNDNDFDTKMSLTVIAMQLLGFHMNSQIQQIILSNIRHNNYYFLSGS